MSRDFPDLIDPWRLAESRRSFKGTWPLAAFDRLAPRLAANDGEVSFSMDFGIDDIGLGPVQPQPQKRAPKIGGYGERRAHLRAPGIMLSI